MLWKLDGLSEYDIRRPLVPTGTNLLGLVQHVASVETGYFGSVFGRPFPEPLAWMQDGEPNGDMWVRPSETKDRVVEFCHRVWAHSDATIDALPLEAMGEVPWWPEGGRELSLHRALVHVIVDISRHAGHADVLRELIDGVVGADRCRSPDGAAGLASSPGRLDAAGSGRRRPDSEAADAGGVRRRSCGSRVLGRRSQRRPLPRRQPHRREDQPRLARQRRHRRAGRHGRHQRRRRHGLRERA